jgi:uncharacterized membrane protein
MGVRGWTRVASDRLLAGINAWLASKVGFYQAFVGSLIWVGFGVAFGFDPHFFYYLFIATLISFVGTFNLAIFAKAAGLQAAAAVDRAESADVRLETMLEQHAAILDQLASSDETTRAVLVAQSVVLENQQHVIESLIELSERDLALGDRLEGAVERLTEMQEEQSKRHIENQRMTTEGLDLMRRMHTASRPVEKVAPARGARVKREKKEKGG